MEINHKFNFVEGAIDTETDKLICTTSNKYAETKLCFKASMNVPFAKIKLYSKDLFIDAKAVNEDAYKLGKEICKRWNMYNELLEALQHSLNIVDLWMPNYSVEEIKECEIGELAALSNMRYNIENAIKKATKT